MSDLKKYTVIGYVESSDGEKAPFADCVHADSPETAKQCVDIDTADEHCRVVLVCVVEGHVKLA